MRRFYVLAICCTALIGCQSDHGDRFIGNWQSDYKLSGHPNLVIERMQGTFTITITTGPGWRGTGSVRKVQGTLKEALLLTDEGITLSIDPKTNIMRAGNLEFVRIR